MRRRLDPEAMLDRGAGFAAATASGSIAAAAAACGTFGSTRMLSRSLRVSHQIWVGWAVTILPRIASGTS